MKKLFVTSPLLPPLEEFIPYLERMWQDKILTNGGQFHQQLEKALAEYLGVKYVCLFSNGTLALLTALQTLRITGEVITTPYSFVATSHSLLWNDLTPVFADIDPVTFNIDPEKIEELITPKTTAILPVHCYGIPCDMERIQRIADTYGLKVVYDAAHCFGVKKDDLSILNYGDLSVLSFHATKVFNTFEGGAIICHDEKTKQRIDFLKNFGFADETVVMAAGINAKMNEVQAAFGLLQLNYIDKALSDRADIYHNYARLIDSKIPEVGYIVRQNDITWNYAYFPIFIKEGGVVSRDEIYHELRNHGIHGRRYFYPLITSFSMYRQFPTANIDNLPVADRVSREVICLPIYPGLTLEQQEEIINVIYELYMRKKQPATLSAVVELS